MPDRPKRRKNKNKRKNNKNSNTDVNKNNIEENETFEESSSSVSENITNENTSHVEDQNIELNTSSETITAITDSKISATTTEINQITDNHENVKAAEISEKVISDEATSDVNPILNKTCTIDEKEQSEEKEEKVTASSNISLGTEQLMSNFDNVNKKHEDVVETYIVETPEQITTNKSKCKLDNAVKSKSCDNDDCPTIVEITDDSLIQSDNLSVTENSNIVISLETDIEWEKVHHFNMPETQLIKGIISSDTIPLNIVHCEQIQLLSPQEESSLRNYLKTLNLSTGPLNSNSGDIKSEIEQIINREINCRLRKKGLTEDTSFIRGGTCRSLAVIDEEGSGDSSKTSRRHSYLSEKKSDGEELEDDVFEIKSTQQLKFTNLPGNNSNKRLIAQPCIRVDAKIKEPDVSEARGDWSMKTIEKMTGAEFVYLTDSSSSTSSVYDLNDDADKGDESDVTVRMITPTIEVTDTESLLSNTFLSSNDCEDAGESKETKREKICLTTTNDNLMNVKDMDLNTKHDSHEIVILRTDNIKTDLFVKDVNESQSAMESLALRESTEGEDYSEHEISTASKSYKDTYDLEIKVLKCELNNAINNLIKEVISDSESNKETTKETFPRQDSSSSLDSSQCTAKYNPTHSSLNDVANILQEDACDNVDKEVLQVDAVPSHVKDVLQCVTTNPTLLTKKVEHECSMQPNKLRDLCVKKISSFPFGDKILEELAHVSLRLQNMSALASEHSHTVQNELLSTKTNKSNEIPKHYESKKSSESTSYRKESSNIPPPILPRKSSLKITQDEPVQATPKTEIKYECLSPSQKMLMEKTNTTIERGFKSQPNVNQTHHDKQLKRPNISINIAPLKSETGSRLLALLQDTSISNNVNTHTMLDNTSNQAPKIKPHLETFSKRLLDELDSTNRYTESTTSSKTSISKISSNSYKPLPPPKPKKITGYFYESDGGSDFRGNSFREMHNKKKYFHYSTGNLNKEIEDDVSSIQNMHRYCTNLRDQSYESTPRRPSLPKDLCDQQMEYIRQKEKEVDAELRRLELEKNKSVTNRGPRAPMVSDDKSYTQTFGSKSKSFGSKDFVSMSQTHKRVGDNKLSSLFSSSQEELLREKMYSEYVNQMAEREQRRQQKVIKITHPPANSSGSSKSMPLLDDFDSKMNNRIEQEFISRARERWCKLGIGDPETEDEKDFDKDLYKEPKVIEHKIKVIEAGKEKDVEKLPSHMQEFVKFTVKDKEQESGSTGESNSDKASAHVVVFCAVIILVLTVGKFLLQLLRNK